MALALKGTVTLGYPDQSTITFIDSSGNYDVVTNPTGYGAPNALRSDVKGTALYLTAPGEDTAVLLSPWTYLPEDVGAVTIDCTMYSPVDSDQICNYSIAFSSLVFPLLAFTVTKNGIETLVGTIADQAALQAYFVAQGFADAYPVFSIPQTEDTWTSAIWTGHAAVLFTASGCVDDDVCGDCPDVLPSTDCDPDDVTCFVDGCWTFRYVVYGNIIVEPPTILAEVTFTQFFYGQTWKRLIDLGKKVFNGDCNCSPSNNLQLDWNLIKNMFDNLLNDAAVDGCDCNCFSVGLASINKRLTILENTCLGTY